MLEDLIEIKSYDGAGYMPLIDFNSWRVAALRYLDEISPERIGSMERHLQTSEVFILVSGSGMLVLGGNGENIGGLEVIPMTIGHVYSIYQNTWHNIVLSRDAYVIVVENRDTDASNSQGVPLNDAAKNSLQSIAREFLAQQVQPASSL